MCNSRKGDLRGVTFVDEGCSRGTKDTGTGQRQYYGEATRRDRDFRGVKKLEEESHKGTPY